MTGGGTGIGEALVRALASSGVNVLAIGRRAEPLAVVATAAPALITPVQADVGTKEGRQAVVEAVAKVKPTTLWLVHNAGTIGPIKPLIDVTEAEWEAVMETNVNGPLFLTKALLPYLGEGSRILHVSSGAAHSVLQGWGTYCMSKAAFNMQYRLLAAELAPRGIAVGSLRPGVVDTPMQSVIRAGDFPDKDRFVQLHEKRRALPEGTDAAPPPNGGLDDAKNVATFMRWLLAETSAEEFSKEEWDIRQTSHHSRWCTRA